jgi:hypothetical protein
MFAVTLRGAICFYSIAESTGKQVANMFGLVMILALVLVTVAPPVAAMRTAKAKSRRR